MPNSDKLIKQGIKYTDQLFAEINKRLEQGVLSSDTLEAFLEKTKEYTTANPLVSSGYDETMLKLILSETNNHKFSRPSQRELVRVTIENRVGDLIQDVGEDIKQNVRDIAKEEYNKGSNPQKIAKQITAKVDGIKNKRARTIARTEVARASTVSDYVINKERGATGFTVSCRSTRCPKCKEAFCKDSATGGDVEYSMDDVSVLPPLHPNCRCSVEFTFDRDKFKGKVSTQKPTTNTTTINSRTKSEPSKITKQTSGKETNSEYLFKGEPKQSTLVDRYTGKTMDVYEFENIKIAFDRGETALTFEEVKAHLDSLPDVFRETNAKIIKIHDVPSRDAAGSYTKLGSELKLYKPNGYTKSEILDTFTHELAHSLDSKGAGYVHSVMEKYEKIFKADNKLYRVKNERTGRYRTPKKFPTEYAGKSWLKYKKNKEKQHLRFVEDFAESTKEFLNPLRHDDFCKKFPNRAKYLEEIYGKPIFDKNSPISQAIAKEGDIKKIRKQRVEDYKEKKQTAYEQEQEKTKKFEQLTQKELDNHLKEVLSSDTHVKAYYGMNKELEIIRSIEDTIMMNDPTPLMQQGYSREKAMKVLQNPNFYLEKNRKKKNKYLQIISEVNRQIKQRL